MPRRQTAGARRLIKTQCETKNYGRSRKRRASGQHPFVHAVLARRGALALWPTPHSPCTSPATSTRPAPPSRPAASPSGYAAIVATAAMPRRCPRPDSHERRMRPPIVPNHRCRYTCLLIVSCVSLSLPRSLHSTRLWHSARGPRLLPALLAHASLARPPPSRDSRRHHPPLAATCMPTCRPCRLGFPIRLVRTHSWRGSGGGGQGRSRGRRSRGLPSRPCQSSSATAPQRSSPRERETSPSSSPSPSPAASPPAARRRPPPPAPPPLTMPASTRQHGRQQQHAPPPLASRPCALTGEWVTGAGRGALRSAARAGSSR